MPGTFPATATFARNRSGDLLGSLNIPPGAPVLTAAGISLSDTLAPPLRGYVRFTKVTGVARSLDVMTTGEPYMLGDGYTGGWAIEERPQRIDATVWRSGKPLRQAVPITMDVLQFAGARNVEEEWDALERMCRPAGGAEPPKLRIAGPVSHTDLRWVIDAIEPDREMTKRDADDQLVRQQATVVLLQYVEPGIVEFDDPGLSRGGDGDRRNRTVSKAGETIKDVAKRALGSAAKWPQIAELYKGSQVPAWVKNPRREIPKGTDVRLPPRG